MLILRGSTFWRGKTLGMSKFQGEGGDFKGQDLRRLKFWRSNFKECLKFQVGKIWGYKKFWGCKFLWI